MKGSDHGACPYLEEADLPQLADLISLIKTGRRGKLLNPYKALLHSPELAKAWFQFTDTVRRSGKIDARLRELVVVRIASLTGSSYVYGQHVPALATAAGVTLDECDGLKDWTALKSLSDRERAALGYTDEMMSKGFVEDDVFSELQRFFNVQEQLELTIIVGMYDMARLVFDTLRIDPEKSIEQGD